MIPQTEGQRTIKVIRKNRTTDFHASSEFIDALDDEDPKIRLQAAKQVLNTAGLKDNMKEKGGPNDVEKTLMQLAEALGMAGKKLGFTEPGKGLENQPSSTNTN